ncbi:MAG: ABC transporter permease, partial [Candidatus Nanopelagicales bacterium]
MTGPAVATRRLPGTLALGWRRVRIELLQFRRDRESAFFTMLLPVLLLIVFGSAFTGEVVPGVTFSQYFLAGMLASGIVYTSFQNLAITIPQERDDGTLKRLQGTPMPKASYFLGKVGLVLVIYVVQVIVMMSIGVAMFGVQLPNTAFDWWTFTWVSLLGLSCCTLLGIAFSGLARHGRGAPALVTPVVLVLQFTSGVFFQYDELPPWMQHFAAIFPLKWLCQGMRSVFLPDSFQQQELA